LYQAKKFITEPFFAVWPNKVNAGEIAARALEKKKEGAGAVFVGAETLSPWDYGVARMEGDRLVEIVENPERGKEPSRTKVVGFYCLEPDFFSYYEKVSPHHEADFVEALNLYLKEKKAALLLLEEDVPALKYPWELLDIMDILFKEQGVKQSIAKTATVGKGTVIEGPVHIGENCKIGPNNVLRGPLNLERGVKTGPFFEIKHSVVQEGTHFHSGYVGDSVVGRDCRFGAGFATANKRLDRTNVKATVKDRKMDTGRPSFGAAFGNEVHVGIQAGTMPGVLVGKKSTIGPGAIAFSNVEDGAILR
jgi:bifunctional UDP-N-acetylglucosamine pyrophosphorylase/glucosamine-1-phosphate N-acetyltransferase